MKKKLDLPNYRNGQLEPSEARDERWLAWADTGERIIDLALRARWDNPNWESHAADAIEAVLHAVAQEYGIEKAKEVAAHALRTWASEADTLFGDILEY